MYVYYSLFIHCSFIVHHFDISESILIGIQILFLTNNDIFYDFVNNCIAMACCS